MAPIRAGDIVVHDVLGLGIDLVATRAVRLAEEFGLRYVITGAFDADRVADQLKERDVTAAFGPVIMLRWMDEVKRLHSENAVVLLDSGTRTAIIAGHPNYPAKYLRISLGLLVGRGISPEQALGSVTSIPAGILSLDGYGEIRSGSVADLALFKVQPWEPEGVTEHTFVGGNEVYALS